MEWEIILSLYEWELLAVILSLLLGSAAFTVHTRTRTIQAYKCFSYKNKLTVSNNININWLFPSIVHPTKIYLLFKKVVTYSDDLVKENHLPSM